MTATYTHRPCPNPPKGSKLRRLAELLFTGSDLAKASAGAGYTLTGARTAMCRLRRDAAAYLGVDECNDVITLRLLFDREKVEAQRAAIKEALNRHHLPPNG